MEGSNKRPVPLQEMRHERDNFARDSHVLLDLWVVEPPADEPLGSVEGVLRVGDGLALGGHTGKALAL